MNIFYLDSDIKKCAQYHCDKHVIKMILEYGQLLCTAVWMSGGIALYRPTHLKHPCTSWVSASISNWLWLKELAGALNEEYRYRYESAMDHRSWTVIQSLIVPELPALGITERPQIMPEEYRIPNDPITAYRQFYLGEKRELLHWRKRGVPQWVS